MIRGWPSITGAPISSKPSKPASRAMAQTRGGEAPVNEGISSVDLACLVDVDRRRGVRRPIRRAVRLEKHPSVGREASSKNLQQPQRIVHPVQDPEAEDEIERLPELVQIECVEVAVVDLGVEQLPDRGKPLASLELDAPARPDPLPVLLVVDRDDPPRAASLGEERVEAVKGAHVEHAHVAEVLGQGRDPVAVVTGHAAGVEPLDASSENV